MRGRLKGSFINQILAKQPEESITSFSHLPQLREIGSVFQSQVLTVLYGLKEQEAGREGAWGAEGTGICDSIVLLRRWKRTEVCGLAKPRPG